MIQQRNFIKSNFQTGDYPTQQQFWDWIDSFIHKTEDTIEISNVKNLITLLNGKADQAAFQQLWELFLQLDNKYAPKDHTHTFASLTEKPTTINGYGIADAYTRQETDNIFSSKKHDHVADEIIDFNIAVEDIINILKNAVNGIAALDANGKLSNEVLPPLSTTEVYTTASEAETLALTAERGDFAVRTDTTPATVYILSGNDPAVLTSWIMVSTAGGILSVNSKSGPAVLLTTTDIPEGTKKYFTDALARAAFSAGVGININATGQISNTLDSLQRLTEGGNNSTSCVLRVTSTDSLPVAGSGLELFYMPSTQRAYIQVNDRSAVTWRELELNASKLFLNGSSGGNVFIGGNGAPNEKLGVNGNGAFTGTVSGSDATQPTHFVTYQQLTNQFAQGTWTPDFLDLTGYVTNIDAYYVKVGNNVRVSLQFQVDSNLPSPQYLYLITIQGLPYPVRNFGIAYYRGWYGTSFADHIELPGTTYQRLNLSATIFNGRDTIMTSTNESWGDIQNKSVVIDITYVTP